MQIICISRGTFSGGKKLAEALAEKLGFDCLAREELTDMATASGIPVGKLEMTVVRRRPMTEAMIIERERYKAFVTSVLCERARSRGLVYHGRTGHLVLPGVTHVLRLRAILDPEQRVLSAMDRLRLSREKAQSYINDVDEDRHRWVRTLYNADWKDPTSYDLVVNLSHMSVENAATALVSMAQLPEFQATPATKQKIDDLLLASRCRLALGSDPRSRDMDVKVRSDGGIVSVTYLPRHEGKAELIPEVLATVPDVNEVLCTMASTNVLWIQGKFDPQSESLEQIVDIATRWNAAVELMEIKDEEEPASPAPESLTPEQKSDAGFPYSSENGGILDDEAFDYETELDEGLRKTRQRLISAGRAGGYRVLKGCPKDVLSSIDRTVDYNLVVVGDLCPSKGSSVSKRRTQEMVSYLLDNMHVPVIEASEMKSQFMFGPAQFMKLLGFAAMVVIMVFGVMSHQKDVLEFISKGTCLFSACEEVGMSNRILSALAIALFVPVFAFCYGGFTRFIFRILRFD